MDTILQILVIILHTFFEGVFVAAEIALVTIRRTRIEQLAEEGNRAAKRVKGLVAQPGRFLAVTQIGLTFLGFLASAYAAVSLTVELQRALEGFEPLRPYAEPLALVVVTLLLALFTIVFGELVPKSLALAHAERYALTLSGLVEVLLRVLAPLVWLLTRITNAVTGILGGNRMTQDQMTT